MGQILVRQLDDALLARLKARAKVEHTSVEALAREAIHRAAANPTAAEKRALAKTMMAAGEAAKIAGARQTPGWELVREDRDRDH